MGAAITHMDLHTGRRRDLPPPSLVLFLLSPASPSFYPLNLHREWLATWPIKWLGI
eukprot:jgi/Botrbrau1/12063/Bobra.0295s0018.1